MYDAIISLSLVILLCSVIYYLYQRSARLHKQTKCGECRDCDDLCATESSRQKVSSNDFMAHFDRLKGLCVSDLGPLAARTRPTLKSIEQCASTCSLETTCLGFNFSNATCDIISGPDNSDALVHRIGSDRSNGECFLKRVDPTGLETSGFTDVGANTCVHLDPKGSPFAPKKSKEHEAETSELCAIACKKDDACTSFSFDQMLSTCLLNSGVHPTRGKSKHHLSTRCFAKRNPRPQLKGYDDSVGECLGTGDKPPRIVAQGVYDVETERGCAELCDAENADSKENGDDMNECFGFTFDKREGKGCQLILRKDNPKVVDVVGSGLLGETFSCYRNKTRERANVSGRVDRVSRALRGRDVSMLQSSQKGMLLKLDDGKTAHVASTYCVVEEGDTCVDMDDPKRGCAEYSQSVHFGEELSDLIDETKLCFRKQHAIESDNVSTEAESFRPRLDKDRLNSTPVLLGQKYARTPGRVEGKTLGVFEDFDKAIQSCNSNSSCSHLAVYGPYNLMSISEGVLEEDTRLSRSFRLKRNGFLNVVLGEFACGPQKSFDSAREAELFCKSDDACTGFEQTTGSEINTFSCEFQDTPVVLSKTN